MVQNTGRWFATQILYLLCHTNFISTKNLIPESTLVAQITSRDKGALEYLYDHYSGAVYGVILRIVRDEEVAREVLQDVFLKIWDRFDNYDSRKGRLFTWIINIARNQAIDKTRSKELIKARKTSDLQNVVGKVERASQVEMPVEGIGLQELLTSLSDEQRFVVEHLYLKGYTQSELAEEFGLPLGTVKTRLRLGMEHLRKLLGVS